MDAAVTFFNAAVLLVVSALAFWAAIDERFPTRIVLTAGLGATSVGSGTLGAWLLVGVTPDLLDIFMRAMAVLNIGVVVSLIGLVGNALTGPRTNPRRRRSDWRILTEAEQHQVSGGTSQGKGS